jgi:hypothetical protein
MLFKNYNLLRFIRKALILLTYITMLILKSFKIIIAIITYFDFKIKQFNIINAFINVIYSLNFLLIIYKLLISFKILKYVVKVK